MIDPVVRTAVLERRLETSRPLVVEGRQNLVELGRLWLAAQPGQPRHCSWQHTLIQEGQLIRGGCSAALLQTTEAGTRNASCGRRRVAAPARHRMTKMHL